MNEDTKDFLSVLKSCKTEEEAKRAGILVTNEEHVRKQQAINWCECKIRIRKEDDPVGFVEGSLPAFRKKEGWEPLPCYICKKQVIVDEEFRTKSFYIVHERCLKGVI